MHSPYKIKRVRMIFFFVHKENCMSLFLEKYKNGKEI